MASPSGFPSSFVTPWKELLLSHRDEQSQDFPNDHVRDPESLITTSAPQTLHLGTGFSLFSRSIVPAILNATTSIHFVTCYWADSPSLKAIKDALVQLAVTRRDSSADVSVLRVTIGFSSWGLVQKLLHTSSRAGQTYPPSQWADLGLPAEEVLFSGGIQMTVKSLFFTPLSVMHPKYVLLDGCQAFIPSANVSWERWLEGCVELRGAVVQNLLAFHERVWMAEAEQPASAFGIDDRDTTGLLSKAAEPPTRVAGFVENAPSFDGEGSATGLLHVARNFSIPTILLPSSHHRNPGISILPFMTSPPPITPLNAALLTLFANARQQITIITPNVTSQPVLDALLEALKRSVDVRILTNEGLMFIEQLVTAGTTTPICLKGFVKAYERLMKARHQPSDIEAQQVSPGKLEILYYMPLPARADLEDEPVASHFKMTLVDDEYLILGSGNMDRASWWTSQELGFLFFLPNCDWQKLWNGIFVERARVFYSSRRV